MKCCIGKDELMHAAVIPEYKKKQKCVKENIRQVIMPEINAISEKKHRPQNFLVDVTEKLKEEVKRRCKFGVLLTDLSKAFNHKHLIAKHYSMKFHFHQSFYSLLS